MQEEISERTIALGEKGTKFTAEMLMKMMREYLHFMKSAIKSAAEKNRQKNLIPHGKMTIEDLVKQNRGAQAMVIDDIGDWDTIAAKYGVDYAAVQAPVLDEQGNAVMQDGKPLMQYNVYFKAQDLDVITEAFKAYTKEHDKHLERDAEKAHKKQEKVQKKEEKKEMKTKKKEQKIQKKKERKNVKEMIKKNKARADKFNRDNPEKKRNRGERSL